VCVCASVCVRVCVSVHVCQCVCVCVCVCVVSCQSYKSGAPCIKFSSLKRKSQLESQTWIISIFPAH